jgi:predicted N-formylglutamate amidohydrolase
MSDVEIVNATAASRLLLICDHASKAVPHELQDLGLTPAQLDRHIGWDIGAAAVARRLAQRLDACAVLAGASRLVIDVNRDPADPTSIPVVSDGLRIPGNVALSAAERERRIQRFFLPYHAAIDAQVARLQAHCEAPALFSVHSFTPRMEGGAPRPWHIGVLWNRDPRIAVRLIENLRKVPDLVVGDNEPYDGKLVAYSLNRHGGTRGLPHCAVEIRQDLAADDTQAERWAEILATALRPILADETIYRLDSHGAAG